MNELCARAYMRLLTRNLDSVPATVAVRVLDDDNQCSYNALISDQILGVTLREYQKNDKVRKLIRDKNQIYIYNEFI